MPVYRAYVDKAKGNDHARVIDFAAADMAQAERKAAKAVKKGEVVGQVVELHDPAGELDLQGI